MFNTRRIFSEDLLKYEYGANKGKINWVELVGNTVRFEYDGILDKVIVESYNSKKQMLSISYNEKTMNIATSIFKECGIGKLLGFKTGEFKIEIGTIFKDDKRDLIIVDREYRKSNVRKNGKVENLKWYKYHCNKCGWKDGWARESQFINSRDNGCSCCRGYTVVEGINSIYDTDNYVLNLGISEDNAKKFTRGSSKKIEIICPYCGKKMFKHVNYVCRTKSIGCTCGDGFSYPQKFIFCILNQLNIDFKTEYSPSYLNKKRSDFYLPSYNLVIEADGGIGHEGGRSYSKEYTLEELVEIDKWKDEQHLKNGVKTIRINCFESDMEYIRNSILNSELSEVFYLSNVDWDECEKFALSNRMKEICDIRLRNPEMSVSEIVNISKIDKCAIIRYLKCGDKLGLCKYKPQEEKIKSAANNRPNNKREVEIFKNEVSLGKFESTCELERKSLELFGTILNHSNISNFIRGTYKGKTYKGYTFKYVDEN